MEDSTTTTSWYAVTAHSHPDYADRTMPDVWADRMTGESMSRYEWVNPPRHRKDGRRREEASPKRDKVVQAPLYAKKPGHHEALVTFMEHNVFAVVWDSCP